MQIHELNRSRRTDEGVMDVVRGVGGAAKTALATAAGIDPNAGAASAGILDPKQKLAAVMKNPDMVKLATQYADEWVQQQGAAVQEDAEVAEPPVKKTTNFGAQSGYSNVNTKTAPSTTTAAPVAQPTATNTTGSTVRKADPNNPNIKDQTKYVQGRAGSGANAGQFAKYDPATSAVANAGQGINNMVKGGVTAQTQPGQPQQPATTAPVKSTGTSMPLKPFQVPGAGTNPTPTNPVGYKASAPPSTYVTDFLKWANQKTAMRDSTTYRTLGLVNAEGSELGPELDAAKEKVKAAQGNPATTKTAVKNYILTAMAALQLVASQNAVKAASTQAPAYGQQGNTPPGATKPAAGQASANAQAQPIDVNALMNAAGLAPTALKKAGPIIQKATGNGNLSATGDDAIDGMLQLMGYNVS